MQRKIFLVGTIVFLHKYSVNIIKGLSCINAIKCLFMSTKVQNTVKKHQRMYIKAFHIIIFLLYITRHCI